MKINSYNSFSDTFNVSHKSHNADVSINSEARTFCIENCTADAETQRAFDAERDALIDACIEYFETHVN